MKEDGVVTLETSKIPRNKDSVFRICNSVVEAILAVIFSILKSDSDCFVRQSLIHFF